MATIQELTQAGARALADNNREAAQYFADEIKKLQAQPEEKDVGVEQVDVEELYRQAGGVEREPYITEVPFPEQAERKKKLYDEDLSFVQNVDRLAFDIGNQFNNSLANMAGAPLNLIGAGMAKIRSKITGDEYVSPDYAEGLRKTMDLLPGVTVLDEEPRTPLGYVGQTGAEAATFLVPQIKGAQLLSATQSGNKGVKVLREVSEQFLNEAAQNTGRFLAIETGMAVGAGCWCGCWSCCRRHLRPKPRWSICC
jgi:hypothetical protein